MRVNRLQYLGKLLTFKIKQNLAFLSAMIINNILLDFRLKAVLHGLLAFKIPQTRGENQLMILHKFDDGVLLSHVESSCNNFQINKLFFQQNKFFPKSWQILIEFNI